MSAKIVSAIWKEHACHNFLLHPAPLDERLNFPAAFIPTSVHSEITPTFIYPSYTAEPPKLQPILDPLSLNPAPETALFYMVTIGYHHPNKHVRQQRRGTFLVQP